MSNDSGLYIGVFWRVKTEKVTVPSTVPHREYTRRPVLYELLGDDYMDDTVVELSSHERYDDTELILVPNTSHGFVFDYDETYSIPGDLQVISLPSEDRVKELMAESQQACERALSKIREHELVQSVSIDFGAVAWEEV